MDKQNENVEITVARIDERTQAMNEKFTAWFDKVASKYVRREEFAPVRNAVYGLIGLICLSVVGAILALVLK